MYIFPYASDIKVTSFTVRQLMRDALTKRVNFLDSKVSKKEGTNNLEHNCQLYVT